MDMLDTRITEHLELSTTQLRAEDGFARSRAGGLLVREAKADDASDIARIFQDTYGESSSHPCADPVRLRLLLASRRTQLLVAVEDDEVIGCVAANALPVAGVMELGCLVVKKGCLRFRLANQLHASIVAHVTSDPRCHLVVAFVRGPSIYRLANRHPYVSLKAWGHDGAMNIALNEREHHLVTIGANPHARFLRARPATPVPAIERALGRVSGFHTIDCNPAWQWSVASLESGSSIDESSSCIELTPPPAGGLAGDALAWIEKESAANASIPHQFVFALLDKPLFIDGLRRQGFRPTAYLPAWAPEDDARRDCLLMVKRHQGLETVTRGFDSAIAAWDRRLRRQFGA